MTIPTDPHLLYQDWPLTETQFAPDQLNYKETVFTIGNGYLGTRGSLEEGYPGSNAATLINEVYDGIRFSIRNSPTALTGCPCRFPWKEKNFASTGGNWSATSANSTSGGASSAARCAGAAPGAKPSTSLASDSPAKRTSTYSPCAVKLLPSTARGISKCGHGLTGPRKITGSITRSSSTKVMTREAIAAPASGCGSAPANPALNWGWPPN
jgi:hypothetical protein